MNNSSIKLLLLFIALNVPTVLFAQCKLFSKKQCIPELMPYNHNGQLNNITLMPGEKAELLMTFYAGQDYRLMVCGQPILGDIQFKVKDKDKKEIYDNITATTSSIWDFKVASTQQLILEVIVPESDSKTKIMESGCVSVLVGFKL
ncbi:MAG: hypothetical protein M3Q58_08460 [Bacteroidota bacterium]|nr:hypothetical protein [Bacteroidota bacterium]